MAAQGVRSARNEARIESVKLIRSRVCVQGTASYFESYDIPNSVTLAIPESGEAVFDHAGDKAPLYLTHLDFGLRLPLHSFIKEVCGALGISPSQLTPTAIGTLTGFIVICNRVKVEPSLRLFSNLMGIKASKTDSHYYFSGLGGFKVMSEPAVRRDWKEQYVWVIGADPILACPTWPEAKVHALRPCILSAEENRHLQKIREYAGSKEMSNLLDPASLRVARVARSPPNDADKAKAALLAIPLLSPSGGQARVGSSAVSVAGPTARPSKRVRGFVGSSDMEALRRRRREVLGAVGSLGVESAAEGEKRRRLDEGLAPSRTSASSADPMAADSPHERTIVLDSTPSPPQIAAHESAEPVLPRSSPGEATARETSAVESSRPGKQVAESSSSAGGAEASQSQSRESAGVSPTPSPRGDQWLPFSHRISEVPTEWWDNFRAKMIGEVGGYGPYEEAIPESSRFVAERPLDNTFSVLGSGIAQVRAVEQFLLPQDEKFLRESPTMGLHLALTSYCVRGALIEQELFSRLQFASRLPADFEEALATEKIAKVTAEEKVAALQAELQTIEGKWRREVEIRDSQVKGLRQHREQQSARIVELEDKMRGLMGDVDRLEHRVKYLEDEVSLEKRHRETAQEEAHTARIALGLAKTDLQEEKVLREAAEATTQSLEVRLAELDSETHKAKLIEEYRKSPFGKFEVAMACKSGFDHLAALLPAGTRPLSDDDYPPRVRVCLDFIREVERTGGGEALEVDIGEYTVVGDQEAGPSRGDQEAGPSREPSPSRHAPVAAVAGGQPRGSVSELAPET